MFPKTLAPVFHIDPGVANDIANLNHKPSIYSELLL